MAKNTGITGKLSVGDVVHIGNPIRKEEYCYYRVTAIDGNKAETGFRTFNRNIYHGKFVYEFGKRSNSIYDNDYTISSEEAAKEAGANVL
jgi:hypothetical protein